MGPPAASKKRIQQRRSAEGNCKKNVASVLLVGSTARHYGERLVIMERPDRPAPGHQRAPVGCLAAARGGRSWWWWGCPTSCCALLCSRRAYDRPSDTHCCTPAGGLLTHRLWWLVLRCPCFWCVGGRRRWVVSWLPVCGGRGRRDRCPARGIHSFARSGVVPTSPDVGCCVESPPLRKSTRNSRPGTSSSSRPESRCGAVVRASRDSRRSLSHSTVTTPGNQGQLSLSAFWWRDDATGHQSDGCCRHSWACAVGASVSSEKQAKTAGSLPD